MRWDHSHGLRRLYFPAIEALPGIFHGIIAPAMPERRPDDLRLNLGLACGTPDTQVWHNRRRMLSCFGQRVEGVYARQVHGKEVTVWDEDLRAEDGVAILDGDGLVTSLPGRGLVIQVADCQPVIIVDPVRQVVANVHSGWRGSVQNIIAAAVARMTDRYGCRPGDLVCGVGPSLGPCCAEFVNYTRELPKAIWRHRRPGDLFDFWQLSLEQLEGAGVPSANIHLCRICTRCNQHLFYSYRGQRHSGRFAAVVGINESRGPRPSGQATHTGGNTQGSGT